MAEDSESSGRIKLFINIATLLALALLIFFLWDQIISTLRQLDDVNYWVLLLKIPIQGINYDAYARMYRHLFATLGKKLPYAYLLKVQLELNFVNNVFPSGGISGFSYFSLRLRGKQVSGGKSTLVQAMKFGLLFITFQALIIAGVIFLAAVGSTNNMTILVSTALATLLLVVTLGMVFIINSRSRMDGFFTYVTVAINRIIQVVRPRHPETISVQRVRGLFGDLHENYMHLRRNWRDLKRPLVYAMVANVTEILSIYVVYIAFGEWVNPGAVILAYAIANFAGLISVLPGGVGVYEALMTAVLATAGVSPALSLPVTVMYRVLSMGLQLPPGYYFYHLALHGKQSREASSS